MRAALLLSTIAMLVLPGTAGASPADEALFTLARGDALDPYAVLVAQLRASAAEPPLPPELVYRDVRGSCDLDGDAIPDIIVNNLTLGSPPRIVGESEIEALSGATGERLWKVDNLAYAGIRAPSTVPYTARGQPAPDVPDTAEALFDVDNDGACDVVAYGFGSGYGEAAPFLGEPSISHQPFTLRVLSGKTGEALWSLDLLVDTLTASDPLLGTASNVVTRGFPTGVLPYASPEGPRVALKLTDLRYHMGDMPFEVGGIPTLDPSKEMLKGPIHAEDVRITEHVQLLDAAAGTLVWERTLGSESATADVDTKFTNLTWLSGVADLDGDATPDLVLDQMVVSTPRTTEANHPATGDTLFRYGRGARLTALDGNDGATLWTGNLLEPLAAEPNAQTEENFETLTWTRSSVVPDLDADGIPDVLASYTAKEESLATTIVGAYRTHFILLSGANGTALWDVRQQGWGVARPIGNGLLGLGMLDVPAPPPEGASFPPRFVRLAALDAATGASVWSYEKQFAQSSLVSYNLALSQFGETLAPFDWDGDGVLDLVTPAQETPRTGRDQVLLATSSHTYSILSGDDGQVLGGARAWGPDGRVLSCPGAEDSLTVLSGHGRRLELARFDPSNGERLWRQVVHNDPTPRAATSAIDVTGLAATCLARPDGGLFYGVDLQAYSFDRLHEVVPILGVLDAEGTLEWQTPKLRGTPPGDALFQASIDETEPSAAAKWATAGFAVAFGLAAAFATIALLVRAGSRLLVVGLVLALLAPGALSLSVPSLGAPRGDRSAEADEAPKTDLTSELPSFGSSVAPAERPGAASGSDRMPDLAAMVGDARAHVLGSRYSNESLSRFANDGTISFTHEVGDVDGDGYDDLALDQYCLDGDACFYGIRIPEDVAAFVTSYSCGYTHDLVVVSGANGSLLWSNDITIRGHFPGQCGENFVVGSFRAGEEMALLVYRYQLVWYSGVNLDGVVLSDLSAVSASTGETLWTYSVKGTYTTDFVSTYVTTDYVLQPMIERGANEDTIFLQGVGWTTSVGSTVFPIVPGYPLTGDQVLLWNVHQPIEWAARLDPATGAEVWKRDTFRPTPALNALPRAHTTNLERAWSASNGEKDRAFWDARPCCGDLTGDGIPELAFTVFEWAQTPMAKAQQPEALDVRFVVYDGATGELHLDRLDAQGLPAAMDSSFNDRYNTLLGIFVGFFISQVEHEAVGDVDGDGAMDVLTHIRVRDPDYRQNLTMVSGKTGEALWTRETPKDLRALVLGDADADGGQDFLLLDWYGHEGTGQEQDDDYLTPQAVPLDLVSGRTGTTIWTRDSYAAPADILESFKASYRNGIADVDGDGVGEFFVDDPLYLDDQTVVHQTTIVSGRDGSPMRTMRTVGGFAVPMGANDLDADGRAETAILSGDVNDLWLTLYDGDSGEAEWSRRVLAIPASGYAEALPLVKLHRLATPAGRALVVMFHLDIQRTYTYIGGCIGPGCDDEGFGSEQVGTYWTTLPQILRVRSENGRLDWALPALDAIDGEARTLGATPGVVAFDEVADRSSAVGLLAAGAREGRPFALPALGGFGLAYAIGLVAGIGLLRLRSRFEGVPELD